MIVCRCLLNIGTAKNNELVTYQTNWGKYLDNDQLPPVSELSQALCVNNLGLGPWTGVGPHPLVKAYVQRNAAKYKVRT